MIKIAVPGADIKFRHDKDESEVNRKCKMTFSPHQDIEVEIGLSVPQIKMLIEKLETLQAELLANIKML